MIYDLAMQWKALISFTPASITPIKYTSPSLSILKLPYIALYLLLKLTNYVTWLYLPLKQIDNKSYLASDRAYMGCDSKMRFLEYEDNLVELLNKEGDID
jgi:hypothetical protein